MPLRTVTRALGLTAALVLIVACGDDGPSESTTTDPPTTTETTVPERPASTTTTAFDPTLVEGEVEAAYLASWDVYADAVYDLELDEQALAEVYAGESLANLTGELESRLAENRPSLVSVEHDYEIQLLDASTAADLRKLERACSRDTTPYVHVPHVCREVVPVNGTRRNVAGSTRHESPGKPRDPCESGCAIVPRPRVRFPAPPPRSRLKNSFSRDFAVVCRGCAVSSSRLGAVATC